MRIQFLRNVAIAALAIFVIACAAKKEEGSAESAEQAAEQKEWKEMDDFHMLMAESFHPFKDSANLAPAKAGAATMASAAEKWAGSTLPEKVNNDDMKSKLASLNEGNASLVQTINAGDDKAIGEQLTKVHDLFHAIQETWYGAGADHHDQH
jgi:outer membrane lipoprotein-sorting protein